MTITIPIEHGRLYHIYNRGNNSQTIFFETSDYINFLNLYSRYIELIADTFAWCLMPNHFHFFVRIKDEIDIPYMKPLKNKWDEDNKWMPLHQKNADKLLKQGMDLIKPKPTQMFQHTFSTYSLRINKKYNRTGHLVERPFDRKLVDSKYYFSRLVKYINYNPVKHRFCEHPLDYRWSSYLSIISVSATKLKRNKVIGWFNSKNKFIENHQSMGKFNDILDILIEDYK